MEFNIDRIFLLNNWRCYASNRFDTVVTDLEPPRFTTSFKCPSSILILFCIHTNFKTLSVLYSTLLKSLMVNNHHILKNLSCFVPVPPQAVSEYSHHTKPATLHSRFLSPLPAHNVLPSHQSQCSLPVPPTLPGYAPGYTPKAVVIDNHLPRQPLISSYVPDWPLPPRVNIPSESEMALRARIYAYNRHLSFDVAFICSTLTHCGVCHLSVWRLKWEVSYVHQSVWRWKWFFLPIKLCVTAAERQILFSDGK